MDYRAEQLNMVQQRVAEEEGKRLKILARIREYDQCIDQAFQDQQQRLAETVLDMNQLQNFPDYIWRLKQSRFYEHQILQQQERKLTAIREELKQAMIKKKSLEILKDKDYAKHRKQIEKAEEEFLAEIAINRSVRQSSHA